MQFLITQWLRWLELFFSHKAVADRLQYICDRGFRGTTSQLFNSSLFSKRWLNHSRSSWAAIKLLCLVFASRWGKLDLHHNLRPGRWPLIINSISEIDFTQHHLNYDQIINTWIYSETTWAGCIAQLTHHRATSYYMHQWWLVYLCIYLSLGLSELKVRGMMLFTCNSWGNDFYWSNYFKLSSTHKRGLTLVKLFPIVVE